MLLLFTGSMYSQIPPTCFEIESIFVDACGNPEGENEMVRFQVGPNALNTSAININWPNNTYLGICQDATTAAKVVQLNSTIQSCGIILEPTGGVLPAGAHVMIVTSTNFNPAANSFSGLTDTLYIIFQCQGNTMGHFANATSSGWRNFSMDFGGGCSDAVNYNCAQLVDIFGVTGTAGSSADRDGATVVYDWAGNSNYINNGCTAPITPLLIDAGPDQVICPGDTIQMSPQITGTFTGVNWGGGNGTWINGNQLNAQYIVSISDPAILALWMSITHCNGTITDSLFLVQGSPPILNPASLPNQVVCENLSIILDAGPDGSYLWSTGETTQTISVFIPGTYYVNAINACGQVSDTAFFTVNLSDVTAAFTVDSVEGVAPFTVQFQNQSIDATQYFWNFGSSGNSEEESPDFTFMHPGDHEVLLIATNELGCSDTAILLIHVLNCDAHVFIPNSFTPNQDEINQAFYIFSTCTDAVHITIFNRWGQEVYEWSDDSLGWHGNTSSGNALPQGIYTYLVELLDLNGDSFVYRGQLNLLR